MRFIINALLVIALATPAVAQAPKNSLRPVARLLALTAATPQLAPYRQSDRLSAKSRPAARPEIFEAALAARLFARMSRLEPVERAEPLAALEQVRAFAEASPLAIRQALRPSLRPGAIVRKAMAQRQEEARGAVCGDPRLQGEKVGFVPGRISGCGIKDAVKLRSVSGIALSQQATIDCTTAKTLKRWVDTALAPAVGSRGGGVARINVAAHYACRSRNNQSGAKISEHGKGRAIDISGVRLRDGTEITVLDGWDNGRDGTLLKKLHRAACGPFGTVLGPGSDGFHRDHFHFDTARHRNGSYCR
nr:extensin family protein [Puniceibacterium confluentis]